MQHINKFKVLSFIVGLIIINLLLTFVLVPAGGPSEAMWYEYRNTEKIDTVYLGSSFSCYQINPMLVDEETGGESFNMGTPGQPMDQTYQALACAIKDKKIKRAVLVFGIPSLEMKQNDNAKVTFVNARKYGLPLNEKLLIDAEFLLSKENIKSEVSINYFFPWIYNQVKLNPSAIKQNVNAKVKGYDPTENAADLQKNATYYGRGYYGIEGLIDVDAHETTRERYKLEKSEDVYDIMRDMCRLCKENGVEFVIINTPKAPYDIADYGIEGYYEVYDRMKDLTQNEGASYYDFNMIKPEYYEIEYDKLADFEHMNEKGSKEFSSLLGRFLVSDDKDKMFYDKDEFKLVISKAANK